MQYNIKDFLKKITSYLPLVVLLFVVFTTIPAYAIDTDADGVDDSIDNCPSISNPLQNDDDSDGRGNLCDNCVTKANPAQLNTDGDAYGNACDADLNNDNIVNTLDLVLFKQRFGSTDPDADFNGDGIVSVLDLVTLKQFFGSEPGPVALAQIVASPLTFDFGDVIIGVTAYGSISLGNSGDGPLDITSIQSSAPFDVYQPTSFAIANESSDRNVSLGFTPTQLGDFSENLVVDSN